MNSYFFFIFFAFLFYYLFRKFVDESLPLLPIINSYKNADDVFDSIIIFVVMFIGGLFGYFVHWITSLFIKLS